MNGPEPYLNALAGVLALVLLVLVVAALRALLALGQQIVGWWRGRRRKRT